MKAQRNARIHANSENLSSSGTNVKPNFEWCSRKRQIVKMLQLCLKKKKSLIFCNQLTQCKWNAWRMSKHLTSFLTSCYRSPNNWQYFVPDCYQNLISKLVLYFVASMHPIQCSYTSLFLFSSELTEMTLRSLFTCLFTVNK